MMARTRDMTEGSPTRLILGFFFPLLFGLLFQQVYNMVDTIVVGKFLGVGALAGVGSTGSLNFLVLGFCIGVSNGFVIPVAQKFGERDYAGMKRYVVNALMLTVVFAAGMTLLTSLLCHQFLVWMNTPADILGDAYAYLFVIFLGIPVVFLYNVLFGIIRSLGDSRTPVVYLMLCSLLNVGLDLFFIVTLHTGVEGAAWATVISQALSCLLCVRYIRHCDQLILTKADWRLERHYVKRLIAMGLPTGLQYSITAIGSIVLQTSVNALGSVTVAAVAAGSKVYQFVCCPYEALGSTMATYGGQNVGARKLERIGQGLVRCTVIGFLYSAFAYGLLHFFSGAFLTLFVSGTETQVIADAQRFLKYNSMFFCLLACVNNVRFLIQGLGFSRQAVFAGVCEMTARTVVGVLLVPAFGYQAVCVANPAAWLAADLFLFPAYFYVMRRLKAKLNA